MTTRVWKFFSEATEAVDGGATSLGTSNAPYELWFRKISSGYVRQFSSDLRV
jgi:hypothetical protein